MDSHTKFHLPGIVNGVCDLAEIRRLVQPQIICAVIARIVGLKVVKDVGKLHRELQTNTLCELKILRQRRIDVPSRQTSKVTDAPAATRIQAENASSKQAIDRGRVSKHIETFGVVRTYPI